MSDLQKYISVRKKKDKLFASGYDEGLAKYRIKVLCDTLKETREKAGLTQEVVAKRLRTQKSAVSRMENNIKDIKLSTLQKYAEACGMDLAIKLVPHRASRTR